MKLLRRFSTELEKSFKSHFICFKKLVVANQGIRDTQQNVRFEMDKELNIFFNSWLSNHKTICKIDALTFGMFLAFCF